MSVRIRCKCGYRMELPDEWCGRQGRCPQCHSVLEIPAAPRAELGGSIPEHSPARGPARFGTAVDRPFDEASEPNAAGAANRNWIAALSVAAALVLVTVGFLLLRGDGESSDGSPGVATSDGIFRPDVEAEDAHNDVFRPAVEPDILPSKGTADVASKSPEAVASSNQKGQITAASKASTLQSWSLGDYGLPVPAGANVIEIDGVVLPVRDAAELGGQGGTVIVLPLGKHIVRFTKNGPARVVETKRWFLDAYREAAAQVQDGDRWSFDRLLELSRQKMDRFTDPLIPHFWGNYYWQLGEREAAARHYAWALQLAPTFAPAYLNLAQLMHEAGDDASARRYLRLANLWNVQNAYGLSLASASIGESLGGLAAEASDEEPDWMSSQHSTLTARDRDMLEVLHSAAEFATRVSERAKILNNLGAYFEHEGKAELALENYRAAAGVFGEATLSAEETRVMRGILENLTRLCRKSNMPEYQRYERLQATVRQ